MVGNHALFTSIINGNIRCILSAFRHLYLKKFSEVRTASGEHHLVVENIITISFIDIDYHHYDYHY